MNGDFSKCIRCGRVCYSQKIDGLCPDCIGDDIAKKEIEYGAEEFEDEDEIRCPWCGKRIHLEEEDSIPYNGVETKCPECGKWFKVYANVRYTYSTKRLPS